MTTASEALRTTSTAILRFLAGSVIVTDGKGRHEAAMPLCSEEETRFLVKMINAAEAQLPLQSSEIDRLYALFCRASHSRYLDLRNAWRLHEGLLVVLEAREETG